MRRSGKAEQAQAAAADSVKYHRPKILLLDCAPEVEAVLTGAGYNAKSGTFGRPYRVRLGSGYLPVVSKASLPNYPEQEIVIIDLSEGEPADEPEGELSHSDSIRALWAPVDRGIIDPRPKVMSHVSSDFNRIHGHGGIFIVFAAPRVGSRYVLARKRPGYSFEIDGPAPLDNWSFLDALGSDNLRAERDVGS